MGQKCCRSTIQRKWLVCPAKESAQSETDCFLFLLLFRQTKTTLRRLRVDAQVNNQGICWIYHSFCYFFIMIVSFNVNQDIYCTTNIASLTK